MEYTRMLQNRAKGVQRHTAPSQTWRTFLDNHVRDLVSVDFFTVPPARLHVLFVFIVLSHERRRVIHFNITEHPTAAWTAQQIIESFPEDEAARYLLRDRDGIYGEYFQKSIRVRYRHCFPYVDMCSLHIQT